MGLTGPNGRQHKRRARTAALPSASDDYILNQKKGILKGSDSDDDDEPRFDGPPPLENDEQVHVFFHHSPASQDTDLIERYVAMLEGAPYEMKCMTNEKDFKGDLNTAQNLVLAIGLSQRVVIVLTDDFLASNYEELEGILNYLLSEDEKRQKVFILLDSEVKVPKELMECKSYELIDEEWNEKLTRILMAGPIPKEAYKAEPTAPPLEKIEEEMILDDGGTNSPDGNKDAPMYQNGHVVRHVTATKYRDFEVRDVESGCFGQGMSCPTDLLCVRTHPTLAVPSNLTKRGLEVPHEDFDDILRSLSEAAKISFFRSSVECTMPCLYLSVILFIGVLSIALWFLSVGAIQHHQSPEQASSSIFWSFMIGIIFVPGLAALLMLYILIRIANKKYRQFRGKVVEFNKKLRDLNLVLHCQKSFWFCSGRLKLYFIYYNFEECQQMLYKQVYSGMTTNGLTSNGHVPTEENANLLHSEDIDHYENGNSASLKIDRIMKRVNSLIKKYEWEYFEKLISSSLPPVEQYEHRKRGMCFCQYVQHKGTEESQKVALWNHPIAFQIGSVTRNLLKKSHYTKGSRNGSAVKVNGSIVTSNGNAHFAADPGEVVFI